MQIAEVRRDAVAQPMAEMRDWLDARHVEPKVFKLTIGTNCVVFRFEFKSADEAADFAQAFDGRVLSEAIPRVA